MFLTCILVWISLSALHGTVQFEGHHDLRRGDVRRLAAHPTLPETLRNKQELENWSVDQGGLDLATWQTKRRPASNVRTGKLRKMFGWGDFHCSVRSSSLELLIKGKIVDHGNGTFSVHFLCNSTGVGNVTVGLAPSSRLVEFGSMRDDMRGSVESKLFNCRVESEKVERSKRGARCSHDPSQSCEHQQTHSHVAWICFKPVKVICVYVSFRSMDYNLLQKVCPDYTYYSGAPYYRSG